MGATPTRERVHLNAEYAERLNAERAMATGNFRDAAIAQNRADYNGYMADKVHYRRYQSGRTFAPYALHAGSPGYGAGFPTAAFGTQGMWSAGAITPGYTAPTIVNPMATLMEQTPVQTAVPIGTQTYDLCMPVPAPAGAATIMAPNAGFAPYGQFGGSNYW